MLTPGSAFVALPGQRTHGNAYLDDALARGAAFLLTDQPRPQAVEVHDPYQALLQLGEALRKRFPGTVVAVTGSVGKTTTKEALATALGFPAPEGNLNTPPALTRFFLHLSQTAVGAVVELGVDRIGEMDELVKLASPEVGVLTAVAPAHLEALQDLETIAREKEKLLAFSRIRIAEVKAARWLRLDRVRTYGFSPEADFHGEELAYGLWGGRFVYRGLKVHLPYPGLGAALGALAALAVSEVLGENPREVAERLAELRLPPGRVQVLRRGRVTLVNDAYNANPASVAAGLDLLRRFPGRKVVVLGEMRELGERAPFYHRKAAKEAAAVAEVLLFVGSYAKAMRDAAGRGKVAADLDEAQSLLKQSLRPGDVVYLKASRAVGLERLLEVVDG
jgi:UDP-N-acetylmuramoyl-tripeptide--D-alanyl-D-alanine ligase